MNLIHYLLEANLYLAAFFMLYVLFLRSETLYQLNRAYLLITSLIAFVIPLLQLGILKPVGNALADTGTISIDDGLTNVTVLPAVTQANTQLQTAKWTLADYELAIYVTVTLALFAYLVFKIVKLIALSKKGTATRKDNFTVIEIPGQNVAFSFFGYLFVNTELLSSQTILHHEEVHIRQRHSWDVIYFELIKIINWFNPVVYLMQRSLKEVHEFIADQQVANNETGAADYADFLISNVYGLTPNQITNSFFNKNLLKRRIIMLYQKKSGRAARLKYLLTLPLLAGLLCLSTMAFTNKNYGWLDLAPKTPFSNLQKSKTAVTDTTDEYTKGWNDAARDYKNGKALNEPQTNVSDTTPHSKTAGKALADTTKSNLIFNAVEHQPQFPGGEEGFKNFLIANIRYPKAAKDAKVSGRVFVQFIIEKDGSLSGLKVLRDPGMGLGDEAVRVLQLSPKWAPGVQSGKTVRVQYTVPVNFALDDDKPIVVKESNPPVPQLANIQPNDGGPPVYNSVEILPLFPGGLRAFQNFLTTNIRYPAAAKVTGVQGRVFVQFIVEKDGSLSNMKVLRDPGSGLGDEAVRVLSLSPKWVAGTNKGQTVRTAYTVPVNFALTDNNAPKDINALYKYVQTHVRYPAQAKENNIQGRVFAAFTVDADKKIQNVLILRAPDKSIADEVTRVITNCGVLSDGKLNTTYTIPVNFSINYDNYKTDAPKPVNAQPVTNKYEPNNNEKVTLNEVVVTTYPTVK
ncbi:outer membrane transport energization protein TonB [Mucilaginibacter gracilis]|uniref:Outer membrane transport energization protein TonB n=1 Tax=Mucilaginibacter gracilis TaxID=423350 RepID=A0A495J8L3_9SPHI|nr:TonB family protein [Mucilaginibacter gracilis]RKR85237.1 outer membrane transport energization protein TonB [Mucilaginibacter gracilis]